MNANRKPTKRKTPWVRRIVSTLILLGLITLIVFLLVKGTLWVRAAFQEGRERAVQQTTPSPVVIEECLPASLEVLLEPESRVVEEGMGTTVKVTVTNLGQVDCKITQAQLGVQLVADQEVLWEPGACSDAMQKSLLLLSPGQPWSTRLSWDGLRHLGCDNAQSGEQPIAVGEGEYSLEARVFGGKASEGVPLVVE